MLGQSVRLQPVPIQSLSELERARLQEVACYHLEDRDLDFKIRIPKETNKRRKSIRRKFDSFSKEKKERESAPKAFGIPLSQVIANDRAFKQRQDALKESRRDCLDLEASVLHFRAEKSLLSTTSPSVVTDGGGGRESPNNNKPQSPTFLDNTARGGHRRGGLSVDSISDLVESQSRLLEALQLSHPAELELKKCAGSGSPGGRTQTKLSLNPIYRQVPRVLERCCSHIENYGLQTVGIFRVGSSKKRVRQLRDEFDMGADLQLDEEQSVHDVAALLKEFLREMPDPLLSRELYPAFLHANLLRGTDQLQYLQHLLYLLPPCNCDTLLRLLTLLHTVQGCSQDSTGPNHEEVSGNKMTSANLAVIFGPNLLQGERGGGGEPGALHSMGIEDSNAIINVTLVLVQNHKTLFTVSAELQQEVLMSLIQTDPDIIDYLLRRKLSGSHLTVEGSTSSSSSGGGGGSECGGRRDTVVSLDSVGGGGASSGSLSPLEPPSPLFPPDSSLTSEVFLNVLKLNHNRKRQEARYTNGGAELAPGKSIRHTRQFHSHHNLLSLVTTPLSDSSSSGLLLAPDADHRRHPQDGRPSAGGFSTVGESSIWVRQPTPLEEEESKPSSSSSAANATNFWDFFTGKGLSGSETIV